MKGFFSVSNPKNGLSVEEKIFIWLLRFTFWVVLLSIPINLYSGFILVSVSCILVTFLYPILYYFAYQKNKLNQALLIYCSTSVALLIFFWFFNAGTEGRVSSFFVLLAIIFGMILPRKMQLWGILFISIVIILLVVIEYFYPNLVDYYDNREAKFLDIAWTNVILILTMYFLIKVLKDSYDQSRKAITIRDFEILKNNKILEQKSKDLSEQNERLENLNESQNRLFSLISHDLRSPLTSSKALVELVYQGDMSIEELQEVVPDMYKNLDFTLSLVDNMLFWAKSQMQSDAVNIEPINLNEFLWNLIDRLSILTHYKKIDLEINLPEDKNITINFDKQILEIVIRNIFSNAIKFSLEYGTIRVNVIVKDNFICIYITDDGVGMSKENLEKIRKGIIFSNKGTNSERGTGLGLNLCQILLQRCNSFLELESKLQKGTTVIIKIPSEYIL